MNCKEEWSREFLVNNLCRSYVNGDYKKHREKLLLGTEKARMGEDMEAAAAFKQIDNYKVEQQLVNEQIRKLKQKARQVEQNIWRCRRVSEGLETTNEIHRQRKEFIKKCPSDSCNGMLSTQWKCQICNLTVCAKCHEIKDDPSSGGGVEHVCKQENIESVKFIKKDTKGCPGCGTDIHKISGCDQMWCPQCKKAFSWKSGHVITHGIIHNPHFNAWQREQAAKGVAPTPRAPGDIVCGGLPGNHQWFALVRMLHPNPERMRRWYGRGRRSYTKKETLWEMIQDLHRKTAHFQAVVLEPIRREVNGLNNNRKLRINYIIGKIGEKDLGCQLSRKAIKKEKATATLHIYELLNTVLTENMVNLLHKVEVAVAAHSAAALDRATRVAAARQQRECVVGATGITGKATSGVWWPVTIERVHPNGKFDVIVEDGLNTRWTNMAPAHIRKMEPAAATAADVEATEHANVIKNEARQTLKNCHEIRLYVNEELKKISVIYGQTVKGVNSNFDIISIKYTKAKLAREKAKKKQTADMTGLSIGEVNFVLDDIDAII